jgi:hypothetical protein
LLRSLQVIQPILRRRPRPKLGCGAKGGRRRRRRRRRRNNSYKCISLVEVWTVFFPFSVELSFVGRGLPMGWFRYQRALPNFPGFIVSEFLLNWNKPEEKSVKYEEIWNKLFQERLFEGISHYSPVSQ